MQIQLIGISGSLFFRDTHQKGLSLRPGVVCVHLREVSGRTRGAAARAPLRSQYRPAAGVPASPSVGIDDSDERRGAAAGPWQTPPPRRSRSAEARPVVQIQREGGSKTTRRGDFCVMDVLEVFASYGGCKWLADVEILHLFSMLAF